MSSDPGAGGVEPTPDACLGRPAGVKSGLTTGQILDQIVEMQRVVMEEREEQERQAQLEELGKTASKVRSLQEAPKEGGGGVDSERALTPSLVNQSTLTPLMFDLAGAGLVERLHGPPWPRQVREKRGTQKRQKAEREEVKIPFLFPEEKKKRKKKYIYIRR